MVSQARTNIAKWKEQALSLTSIIPLNDDVMQETLGLMGNLSAQLVFMAKLQSPTLRQKHWRSISEGQHCVQIVTYTYNHRISNIIVIKIFHLPGMGIRYVPGKKLTVAEILSKQPDVDLKFVTKVSGRPVTYEHIMVVVLIRDSKILKYFHLVLLTRDSFAHGAFSNV